MTIKASAVATASSSFPVLGILGVALVVAKAIGLLTWPWVWVLAPFWIGPAIFLGVIVLGLTGFALFLLYGWLQSVVPEVVNQVRLKVAQWRLSKLRLNTK